MTKKFLKDNRGQVLYAVVVAVMFLGVLSMIAMGLTLQHYHAAVQKQENIEIYYELDAVAELIRIGEYQLNNQDHSTLIKNQLGHEPVVNQDDDSIKLQKKNVSLTFAYSSDTATGENVFTRWEVSYNEAEPEPAE